jgi:hypothetical protein
MSTQEILMPGKAWAQRFNALSLFEQIRTLHNLSLDEFISLELKKTILTQLSERVMQYSEIVHKKEHEVDVQLAVKQGLEKVVNGEKQS